MRKIKNKNPRQQETLGRKRRNRTHNGRAHRLEYKMLLRKFQDMMASMTRRQVETYQKEQEDKVVIHTPGVGFVDSEKEHTDG